MKQYIFHSLFIFIILSASFPTKGYSLETAPVKLETTPAKKVKKTVNKLMVNATFEFPEMDRKIDSLRKKYQLPGVTVAIVRNDKLVYINCYGYQDSETPAQNNNLFRIASISKPVTLVALMKLMQNGNLSMDDKVFGANGILGEDFGPLPAGGGWEKITIRHLIEHKSGIQNVPNDPMFAYKGLSNKEIISSIISERPLASQPGETNYYSNVGYNILGRVIEKISGKTYEEYVKTEILAPCGITNMKIGLNTLEQRFPNEVAYDQPDEPGWTYGMDVYRMDSHGGWIASASDLARLITHTNRIDIQPDIIDKKWLEQTYFGFEQWTHNGSLPGTATMLTRMNDEFSFVFLTNKRSWDNAFFGDISNAMQTAIKSRKSWPDKDLFGKIKW